MNKVAIIGHFAYGHEFLDGQTIKTRNLEYELRKIVNPSSLVTVDTYRWHKNPLSLLLNCILVMKNSKNIVILPAHNGVRIILPLLIFLNLFFSRKIHYVVIGGWLPDFLRKKFFLKKCISKLNGIYVETLSMANALKEMGLKQTYRLTNFKRLDVLDESQLVRTISSPYKLCTFSRVMLEKGIEDAVFAVIRTNEILGMTMFYLDIYGQIDAGYKERFSVVKDNFPDYISYKGVVNSSDTVSVLKDYFVLLFPTYYEGEGFAGTIIDAFASGLPIIASDWKYNAEIVKDGINGLIYECRNNESLIKTLVDISRKPEIIIGMKRECLKSARQYSPENSLKELISNLSI